MYIADLHIHSRFSRATSRDLDAPQLDLWARRKGISLIGTGDFTHPSWRSELKEQLVLAEDGVYKLKEEFKLPCAIKDEPRFIVTGEISSIYKKNGKTRKVHNLIILPSLEAADELSAKLEAIGNIHSDGRPILGLDSRDLLELTLETCPDAEFIPAHIWTPHFSMFGAFSGFSSIEECFDDLSGHIHAVETGLSSDPPMNWRVSALDGLTLVSNSDAHSASKLGREANILDTEMTYPGLIRAIRSKEGFLGTIEFFPEEGKYHLDGHRNCGVCLNPDKTMELGGICPVCGRKLTIGVEHRVEELADRPQGFKPNGAKPFESLAPLPETIAASTGWSASSKKNMQQYERMLDEIGPEFFILRQAPTEDIQRVAGPCIAEGISRLRAGKVERTAGFDGEYGTISLLTPLEIEKLNGQFSLFGFEEKVKGKEEKKPLKDKREKNRNKEDLENKIEEKLNFEQHTAVCSTSQKIAVIAGPGTGKTKTLVSRIAYLVEQMGVKPSEITAVTFTNQAASEMRQRLEKRLGGKRAVSHMTIGTFHSICLSLLSEVHLISTQEALTIASDVLAQMGEKMSAKSLLREVSLVKNGMPLDQAKIDEDIYLAYCSRLKKLNLDDFDDLLLRALEEDFSDKKCFKHLLVDEFQDINDTQYLLVLNWSKNAQSLFVIGDPDQSIYGFRGANGRCFEKLSSDYPQTEVIRLIENYRSSPQIIQASLPIINKNAGEKRRLIANQSGGPQVRLISSHDDFAEGVFIAKEIGKMTGGVDMLEAQRLGYSGKERAFSDIAVLSRTHRQLELIEKCLRHDDIPCVICGRGDFLEDDDVRGVISFLRFLEAPDDLAALETSLRLIWNSPNDIIGEVLDSLKGSAFDEKLLPKSVFGYGHLEALIERMQKWLPIVKEQKPWRVIELWEELYGTSKALERLRNTAVFYPDFQKLFDALTLGQEADIRRASGKGWESGAVHLMTLHGSKGLEFPSVFVTGVKQRMLPLETKGEINDEEEERRLMFVGMTRAREELIITTVSSEPSKFLEDLPTSIVKEKSSYGNRPTSAEQFSLF